MGGMVVGISKGIKVVEKRMAERERMVELVIESGREK